jgi:hypothetical protein
MPCSGYCFRIGERRRQGFRSARSSISSISSDRDR